ncbi:hypothetical protein PAUR_a4341 [Pseudoalteromonas aurantia 208]|uniref:Uncharacterized protein n=1 Tax=Pseudoalteromonas aurantia 208 TaxID=1314867 RepID=A0ABR9EFK3_9GAMM|nr:hypothetical protein [Pseudoalteromonas aurantia 208]
MLARNILARTITKQYRTKVVQKYMKPSLNLIYININQHIKYLA